MTVSDNESAPVSRSDVDDMEEIGIDLSSQYRLIASDVSVDMEGVKMTCAIWPEEPRVLISMSRGSLPAS